MNNMKSRIFFKSLFMAIFCLIIASSLLSVSPVEAASKKNAPKAVQKTSVDEAEINDQLRVFAGEALEKMNRLVIPSKNKKEIKENADGSWTARYTEVDTNSISTSIKAPEDSRLVQYVGYMRYVDVEYECKAASKEAAVSGPFKVKSKEGLTELVKYMKGKWGY